MQSNQSAQAPRKTKINSYFIGIVVDTLILIQALVHRIEYSVEITWDLFSASNKNGDINQNYKRKK
jgi:hypothetical protein